MSETIAEAKPQRKKPGPKPKAKAIEPVLEEPKPEVIPEGMAACYVAIPGRVSRGDGLGKANAGERVIGPEASVKELKRRGLAAPKKELAQALFEQFKEQEEARIAEETNAEATRRAHRDRLRAEQLKNAALEWNG